MSRRENCYDLLRGVLSFAMQPGRPGSDGHPLMAQRRRIGSTLLLLTLAALPSLPLAWGQAMWVRDRILYMYPAKMYVRERLLAGDLGLWTERIGLGRPFFGTIHAGVLYPGNLLILLIPPPLGIDLLYAVHLAIAGFGMRAWLRRTLDDEVAATFGGILLALSGHMVGMLSANGAYVVGVAWIPWALAVVARVAPDDPPHVLAGAAARIAVLAALCPLGGDPQAAHTMALLCLAHALALPGRRARALAVCALGGALAAVVAAIQLAPGLEVAALGRPGGLSFDEAKHFSLHPSRLIELAWPQAFGDFMSGPWSAWGLYDEGTGRLMGSLLPSLYVGAATPWLALGALFGRRRLDVVVGVAGLLGLLIALGRYTPVFDLFFHHVPGSAWFRHPEKYWFVPTLCIAALAARGLTLALAAPARALRIGFAVLGVLGVGAAAATFGGERLMRLLIPRLLQVEPAVAAANLAASARLSLLIVGAMVLLLALAVSGRLPLRGLRLALPTIVVIDVLVAALPLMDWIPARIYHEVSPVTLDLRAAMRGDKAAWRLYRHTDAEQVIPGVVAEVMRMNLNPNCGTEDGVIQLDAFEVFQTPRDDLLRAALSPTPLRLLQVTSTRFALLRSWEIAEGPPRGMRVLRRYPELASALLEVAGAAPRAYLAQRAIPAPDAAAAARRLTDADFTPGVDAVIEGAEARLASGTCAIDRWLPESLSVRCHASAPAYLVISDAAAPGWTAAVDGRSTAIQFANVAMRGVAVPAGDSLIELTYRPRSLAIGAALSAFGLAVVAALLFHERRRRRAVLRPS